MAWITGTATSYTDLVDQLRDYITGVSSPSISNWTAVRDITTGGEREVQFRGDGGVSPEDEIYFGIKTYSDVGAGRYNWEVRGFTAALDNSPEEDFETGPGASPPTYVPLQNVSMNYWFFANARRVIVVVRTGAAYQFMYAGFINPYTTESEWPYPLAICGSTSDQDQIFNDNTLSYATLPHPGSATGNDSPVMIRFVDGQWYEFLNFRGTSSEINSDTDLRNIWPLAPTSSNNYDAIDQLTAGSTFNNLIRNASAGGTPTAQFGFSPGSPSIVPVYPATAFMIDPSEQFLGEFDGVYWISAGGGVVSEDVLTDSSVSPEQNYLAFQNIHRTDAWMFMAIRRD